MFLYALIEFWKGYADRSSLSFEALMYEPGSPARVFLLDEDDVSDRLASLEDLTAGKIRWSETAGLKQVIRDVDLSEIDLLKMIQNDYPQADKKEVA